MTIFKDYLADFSLFFLSPCTASATMLLLAADGHYRDELAKQEAVGEERYVTAFLHYTQTTTATQDGRMHHSFQ